METSFIIPTAVLQECAVFAYQNGLTNVWDPFYKAAMNQIAGTAKGTPRNTQNKAPAGAGATRSRISKNGQTILSALPAEGMAKRAIVTATKLTAKQVEAAVPTMLKNGIIYQKNGRYFAGPNPAKAATEGAGKAPTQSGTKAPSSTKAPSGLSAATLTAVRNLPQGSTNAQVVTYVNNTLGNPARSNHIGIALQRHKRAGRLEQRDGVWYTPVVEEMRQAS